MILWKWQGLVFGRISCLKNFFCGKCSVEIRVQQTPLAVSGPPVVFVNNILLEYGISHFFMCSLWLLLWYSDRGKSLHLLKWLYSPWGHKRVGHDCSNFHIVHYYNSKIWIELKERLHCTTVLQTFIGKATDFVLPLHFFCLKCCGGSNLGYKTTTLLHLAQAGCESFCTMEVEWIGQ